MGGFYCSCRLGREAIWGAADRPEGGRCEAGALLLAKRFAVPPTPLAAPGDRDSPTFFSF